MALVYVRINTLKSVRSYIKWGG